MKHLNDELIFRMEYLMWDTASIVLGDPLRRQMEEALRDKLRQQLWVRLDMQLVCELQSEFKFK